MKTFLFLTLICLLLAVAGCRKSNYQVEQTLRGEWKEEGVDFYATFSEDHTGSVDYTDKHQPFTWKVLPDGRVQVTDPTGKVFYLKFDGINLKIEGTKSLLFRIK